MWSVEGSGSTFTLRLPLALALRRAGPEPRRPAGSGQLDERKSVTRVLVVEDEESFSDALSYMLRREGFEVAVAATGPDALTEFDRSGADLVLLDLMLPGLSGTEVCRATPAALQRADHHADRPRLRDRQGRRAGARRRRLRHQAVLLARAGGADPGRAAPRRRRAGGRGDRGARGRAGPDGRRAAHRDRRRRAGAAAAQGVRPAGAAAAQRRPGADPRPAHRPGLGLGLRRRHQDPRRPRQAAAGQDRAATRPTPSTW